MHNDRETAPRLRSEAFLRDTMDRFGDAVYRTALSRTRSAIDAEDVFQDVFVRLLKDETAFASADHLKAWLLRVTVNRCRDLARRRASRPSDATDNETFALLPDTKTPSVHEAAFGSAASNAVADAVALLPDSLREVVHLFYGEGCQTDEIARIVGCSPVTVRTRLHRARVALRETLERKPSERAAGSNPAPSKQAAPNCRSLANQRTEQTDQRRNPHGAAASESTL